MTAPSRTKPAPIGKGNEPWWLICLRLAMGGLFVYAGVLKAWDPAAFLQDIESFRLLPYAGAVAVAYYLPYFEILAGLALCYRRWSRASGLLLAGLMLVFITAIAAAWARGLDISCGCFGKSEVATNYPWLIFRDCLMLAALLRIAWIPKQPDTRHLSCPEHGLSTPNPA